MENSRVIIFILLLCKRPTKPSIQITMLNLYKFKQKPSSMYLWYDNTLRNIFYTEGIQMCPEYV